MKPGYKTVEFWLAFLVTSLGATAASGAFDGGMVAQLVGLAVGALGAAGYSAVRAFAKGPDGKPAYKTTEFWLSVASVLVGGLMAAGMFGDGSTAMSVLGVAASVLGALGYAVPKAYAKGPQTPPPGE